MKKDFVVIFVAFVFVIFAFACKNSDTKIPDPNNEFFAATIADKEKLIAFDRNGYAIERYDTVFTDTLGDHYTTGIRLFQSKLNFNVSSKEEIRFEIVNLISEFGNNKDSIFHAAFSRAGINWYVPKQVKDSSAHSGMRIVWHNSRGESYFTDKVVQSGVVAVDSTVAINDSVNSKQRVFLRFNCNIISGRGEVLPIKDGRARLVFVNNHFF